MFLQDGQNAAAAADETPISPTMKQNVREKVYTLTQKIVKPPLAVNHGGRGSDKNTSQPVTDSGV